MQCFKNMFTQGNKIVIVTAAFSCKIYIDNLFNFTRARRHNHNAA